MKTTHKKKSWENTQFIFREIFEQNKEYKQSKFKQSTYWDRVPMFVYIQRIPGVDINCCYQKGYAFFS